MSGTKILVRALCIMIVSVPLCSCGSDSSTTTQATVVTVDSTEAVASVPPSPAPNPTVSSDPTPSSQSSQPDATPLPGFGSLTASTVYSVGKGVMGRPLTFQAMVDGSYGQAGPGFFGTSLDQSGTELLVGIVDLGKARVFVDPVADLDALQTSSDLEAVTESAPTDYLGYFASLPGVQAEPVQQTEFAGFPAQSIRYTIGTVTGAIPCFEVDRGGCLLAMYVAPILVATYWSGDTGTLYQFIVDDRTLLVDVTDREGAAETAASFEISPS